MPDGKVVDATDWNLSWGWAAGNMISTLDDMRVWARDLAMGKLISPAMKRERHQFLPAPEEGDGALYGLALENQNGWIGHNGNTMSYMVYPYYLPDERMTMVVMLNSGVNIPGNMADDAGHRPDHEPQPSLDRPAEGVGTEMRGRWLAARRLQAQAAGLNDRDSFSSASPLRR